MVARPLDRLARVIEPSDSLKGGEHWCCVYDSGPWLAALGDAAVRTRSRDSFSDFQYRLQNTHV